MTPPTTIVVAMSPASHLGSPSSLQIRASQRQAPGGEHSVASICCYCGTGCGVRVHVRDDKVVSVQGDTSHPSSMGALCSKGTALIDTVRADQTRVLRASMRSERGAARQDVPLDTAYSHVADTFADIITRHGPDAVAFYVSGQLLTEDYAVFNKLARALIGTNNIDTNSRLCMSSAVAGYKQTLGADAPPACYEDLDHADTVIVAGSNMAYAHPVLFRRLMAAKSARTDMKIVVVDPRRTETAAAADLHLAITPGTDVALFHAMLNVMIWEDLLDRDYIDAHTTGFSKLKARVHDFTPQVAQGICGVPAADITQAARWFAQSHAALSLYTMGLNQSSAGTAKNASLIHLHLACGQIGRVGAGPFSLTGQPNAMGGREAGGMATLLPGHREPGNPEHRQEVADLWGVPSLPDTPGAPAVELFERLERGDIKAVWIVATNPAQSMPDQAQVRRALACAEFVVLQDAFAGTETARFADVVLPAATWPEKEGTVTNSERRISRVRAAIAPPGDARPDWELAINVARRLARRIAPQKADLFEYAGPADIFAEHARSTAGRDLDYSALDYARLDVEGPQQWPYVPGRSGSARLYGDGVFPTESGRARFVDVGYVPVAEAISARYPLHLTTGRLRDHWHTLARTALSPALTRHVEEPALGMHPADMARRGLVSGALIKLNSKRGALYLPAVADANLQQGHAFLPMHWGSAFMAGQGINAVTLAAVDPVSFQPELKHCAVEVIPAALPWQAVAWLRGDPALLRHALSAWLARWPYVVLLPVDVGGAGLRIRIAAAQAPASDVLNDLIADLTLTSPDVALDDPARGIFRRILLRDEQPIAYALLGDIRAHDALAAWAAGARPQASLAHVLTGRTHTAPRDAVVCACHNVGADAIDAGIARGLRLDDLKRTLKCGTGCGACVPEIASRIGRATSVRELAQ